ncbi:MAG: T9SS type A sorting domain-containing protein [Saprospiraceae bacterium]|nr:T9SS type A sorting domain-containing protein [Saprospiraceae bacterium]
MGQVRNNNNSGCNSVAEVTAACISSSDDETNFSTINLYPNPVSETLNIQFENSNHTAVELSVRDISGKILLFRDIFEKYATIDFSCLSSGIYFVNLNSNHQTIISKVVKL